MIKAGEFLKNPMGNIQNSCGNAVALQNESGRRIYLLGVYDNSLATLVHEVGHVTLFVMEYAGIDAYDSLAEPVCYLLGDMYEKLEKAFKNDSRRIGKRKNKEVVKVTQPAVLDDNSVSNGELDRAK